MRYNELTARVVEAGLGVITFPEEGSDNEAGRELMARPPAASSDTAPEDIPAGGCPDGAGPGSQRPAKPHRDADPLGDP